MKNTVFRNTIILQFSILLFMGCDPTSTRDCGTFTYDISEWSTTDDNNDSSITFLDDQSNEFEFKLIESLLSEPYEESQIGASTPDDVGCFLTKANIYRNDELETELSFIYEHYELPSSNWVNIYFYLGIKNSQNDTFIRTQPLYFNEETLNEQVETVEEIEISDQIYNNVFQFPIVNMLNSSTIQVHSDTIFRNLFFKPPMGLVQIEFSDGTNLIKKE